MVLSCVAAARCNIQVGVRQIAHFLHPKAKILYSANGLYAIEKPVNILSHPNKLEDVHKSVIDGMYDTKEERFTVKSQANTGNETVYLINRLDSATSGIILMTTNEEISKTVKKLFAERKITKVYRAIVFFDEDGGAPERNLLWEDTMQVFKVKGSNRALQCDVSSPNAMHAVTTVTITDPKLYSLGRHRRDKHNLMLIELRPKTGYTHQLRYQCALHNMPILGDRSYGKFKQNRAVVTAAKSALISDAKIADNTDSSICPNRMMLHSYSIEFSYEINDISHQFKAVSKLPAEFKLILDNSYNSF